MSNCELLWSWQRWKCYFSHCPGKNTQCILVNRHMLWHKTQIWRQLSAGIKRHQSNPEERLALTVPSKTKLQDITIGKAIRGDRKTESIVRENGQRSGQSWLSGHLVCYTGRERKRSERREVIQCCKGRDNNAESISVGKSIRIWIMAMNAVPFGCHESQIWARCWARVSRGHSWGDVWFSPKYSLEGLTPG